MRGVIIQKAAFRPSGTKRLVWAMVLAQREGLTLLLLPSPDRTRPHALVVAAENTERVYEPVNVPAFPLEQADLEPMANRIEALAESLGGDEIERFLGEWWQ